MKKKILATAVAMCALGCATSAQAGRFVVMSKTNGFDAALARKVEAAGGVVTARLPQIGVAIVESPAADFASRAGKVQGVRSVTADVELKFTIPESKMLEEDAVNPPGFDNDRYFNLQWPLAAIDAAGAWNAGYRGAGATVAVLDAGVACAHADIAPNLLLADSTSFVPGESVCLSHFGFNHGTHVAGTIAAPDNGIGTIGVAPEAKFFAVKVLSEVSGGGSFAGIIQGIVYAADHGADVINMSLGVSGGLNIGGKDVAELVNATARATRYAASQNALIVASAGNDAIDLDHASGLTCNETTGECQTVNLRSFPSSLPGVLAVSATAPVGWGLDTAHTPLDNPASYSNYGQSAIDLAAPGGDFVLPGNAICVMPTNTTPIAQYCWALDMVMAPGGYGNGPVAGSSYTWSAGTSMAAPHVSGVAALIIGKNGGEMSPAAVIAALRASADDLGKPGNDDHYGAGRVNARRAVQ
jgi:subtilisin family serine protease